MNRASSAVRAEPKPRRARGAPRLRRKGCTAAAGAFVLLASMAMVHDGAGGAAAWAETASGGVATDLAVAAERLQPHRAVYDIALGDTASSSSIAAVSGRIVFEFTGSPCDGFAVNSRFVTRMEDQSGSVRLNDLRSATFETLEPETFSFRTQTFTDRIEQQEVAGEARIADEGLEIELREPEDATVLKEVEAMFPTAHMASVIMAALAGERVFEANLFDGADEGQKVFQTTAIIGARQEGVGEPGPDAPEAVEMLAGVEASWRVAMSYFDEEDAEGGEQVPSYELRFLLHDNGISRDLVFDYGQFTLTATLKELVYLDKPACQ